MWSLSRKTASAVVQPTGKVRYLCQTRPGQFPNICVTSRWSTGGAGGCGRGWSSSGSRVQPNRGGVSVNIGIDRISSTLLSWWGCIPRRHAGACLIRFAVSALYCRRTIYFISLPTGYVRLVTMQAPSRLRDIILRDTLLDIADHPSAGDQDRGIAASYVS